LRGLFHDREGKRKRYVKELGERKEGVGRKSRGRNGGKGRVKGR